jgi:endonuclease/exonuclease/phosphatase family metal-dependent hydrolase
MDGQRSAERIADVVLAQNADIVCLQEVHQRLPQSGFVD